MRRKERKKERKGKLEEKEKGKGGLGWVRVGNNKKGFFTRMDSVCTV